jgi:hypothetical protein
MTGERSGFFVCPPFPQNGGHHDQETCQSTDPLDPDA